MSLSTVHGARWRIAVVLLLIALVLSMLPLMSQLTRAAGSHTQAKPFAVTFKNKHLGLVQSSPTPPTDKQCRKQFGSPCYSPQEIRNAYDVTPVLKAGFTGKG